MKPFKRSLHDGESACGSVNVVQRIGNLVARPTGKWSSSVHELLRFLEKHDFDFSPRFIDCDKERRKEHLSYIDGEVALRPWPEVLRSLSGLEQIANMLTQYHDIIVAFNSTHNIWHLADRDIPVDFIIRHGDIGPWNMVWNTERLVGLIDWDFAEPGTKLEDIAQAAWHCIPLKPEKRVINAGILPEQQLMRLEFFCEACGVSVSDVLRNLSTVQNQEITRMRTHGKEGVQPWASFFERGDLDIVNEDADWLSHEF